MPKQTHLSPPPAVDEALARRVLEVVSHGLSIGKGKPVKGMMCVEAAVCYAMDLPHSDRPPCVGGAVRAFKVALNDSGAWKSKLSRAEGMKALSIAQLGSDALDQVAFARKMNEKMVKALFPFLLKEVASELSGGPQALLEAAAFFCEEQAVENWLSAAQKAVTTAKDDWKIVRDKYMTASVQNLFYRISSLEDSLLFTPAISKMLENGDIISVVQEVAVVARMDSSGSEAPLRFSANIALEVLKEMKSPGCEFLYLLDPPPSQPPAAV